VKAAINQEIEIVTPYSIRNLTEENIIVVRWNPESPEEDKNKS